MLWALDDQADALTLRYPYFEHVEPIVSDESATYVGTDVVFTHRFSHCWNHGLGEIITAVDAGMRLTALVEHDSVPWEAASYTSKPPKANTVGVVNSTGATSQAPCDVGTVDFTTRLSPAGK